MTFRAQKRARLPHSYTPQSGFILNQLKVLPTKAPHSHIKPYLTERFSGQKLREQPPSDAGRTPGLVPARTTRSRIATLHQVSVLQLVRTTRTDDKFNRPLGNCKVREFLLLDATATGIRDDVTGEERVIVANNSKALSVCITCKNPPTNL